MKPVWIVVCGLAVLGARSASALVPRQVDFERYQVILDRQPFGEPPVEAGAPDAAAQAASWTKDFRLCMITETDDGQIRVGLVRLSDSRTYYLSVGESEDDIQIVDADFEEESALVKKGSDERWLAMNDEAGGDGGGGGSGGAPAGDSVSAGGGGKQPSSSAVERLRRRRETVRHREVEAPKMSQEDLEKHLQQYNFELIKNGEPPLPIPLTPEQDAQLVQEGVLPAAEAAAPEAEAPAP